MFTTLNDAFTALSDKIREKFSTTRKYTPEEAVDSISVLSYDKILENFGTIKQHLEEFASGSSDHFPLVLVNDFSKYLKDHYDSTKSTSENFDQYLTDYPNGYAPESSPSPSSLFPQVFASQKNCIERPAGTGSGSVTLDTGTEKTYVNGNVLLNSFFPLQTLPENGTVPITNKLLAFFFPKNGGNLLVFHDQAEGKTGDPTILNSGWYSYADSSIAALSGNKEMWRFEGGKANDEIVSMCQAISRFYAQNALDYSFGEESWADYGKYLLQAIISDVDAGRIGITLYTPTDLVFPYTGTLDMVKVCDGAGENFSTGALIKFRLLKPNFKRYINAPYVNIGTFVPTQEEIDIVNEYFTGSTPSPYYVLQNPDDLNTTYVFVMNSGNDISEIPVPANASTVYAYVPSAMEIRMPSIKKFDSAKTITEWKNLSQPANIYCLLDLDGPNVRRIEMNEMSANGVFLQADGAEQVDITWEHQHDLDLSGSTLYLPDVTMMNQIIGTDLDKAPSKIVLGENIDFVGGVIGGSGQITGTSLTEIYFTSQTPPSNVMQEYEGGSLSYNSYIKVYCPVGSLQAYANVLPDLNRLGMLFEGSPSITPLTKQGIEQIGEGLLS